MSKELPKATHSGILKLGTVEIRVYRLDNGQAIIHADDLPKIFSPEAMFTAEDAEKFTTDLNEFTRGDTQ